MAYPHADLYPSSMSGNSARRSTAYPGCCIHSGPLGVKGADLKTPDDVRSFTNANNPQASIRSDRCQISTEAPMRAPSPSTVIAASSCTAHQACRNIRPSATALPIAASPDATAQALTRRNGPTVPSPSRAGAEGRADAPGTGGPPRRPGSGRNAPHKPRPLRMS